MNNTVGPLPPGTVPVMAVNMKLQFAVLEDGRTAPFKDMFDDCGEPTDDPYDAYTVVLPHPDGGWLMLDLSQYDDVTQH